MNKEIKKTISVVIQNETWKKLKMLSIQKDTSLGEVASEILDKVAGKKSVNVELNLD